MDEATHESRRLQRAKGSRARRDPKNNLGVERGQSEEKDTGLESSESEQSESKAKQKGIEKGSEKRQKGHSIEKDGVRKVAKAKRGKKRALESKWQSRKCTNLHSDGQEKQNLKKRSSVGACACI